MKKMYNSKTVVALTAMLLMATPILALAEPGISGDATDWFWRQLSTVVLVVTVGLAVMFYIQKATSKMIVTIIVGGFLYVFARTPSGILNTLGNWLKGMLGL